MKNILLCAFLCVCFCGILCFFAACKNNYNYADGDSYNVGDGTAEDVTSIELDWIDGEVIVGYYDGSGVKLSEKVTRGKESDKLKLRWKVQDGTLVVKYCASGMYNSIEQGKKTLTLSLPESFRAQNVVVNLAAASLKTAVIKADEISVNSASGNVNLWASDVTKVNVSTASATIDLVTHGRCGNIDLNSTSGAITLNSDGADDINANSMSGRIVANVKSVENINLANMSGSVDLRLPTDVGMTAKINSTSGKISVGFDCKTDGGTYVRGDGKINATITTVSGRIDVDALAE